MKKLVSILLVIVLVLGAVVTVSANDSYPVQEELVYQFEDKFVERYCATYDQIENHYDYDELYYHYDENGQIDWTLIEQCSYNSPPWNYHTIYKDRILMYGDFSPFTFKYGVYDSVEDEFYDIFSKDFDFSKYEGLEEIFDSIEPGYPIGDADFDGELSVLDATFIQRALARLSEFHYRDEINATAWHIGSLKYMSDFDRDGKRSIIDATAIQRKLAMLDSEPVDKEPTINEEMIFSDYSQRLRDLPEGTVELTFNKEYSAMQFLSSVYNEDVIGTRNSVVVIKSNEQYKTLFNSKAPEFTDEFFESNWLVAAFIRTGCYEGIAPISKVAKDGDTLYVQATVYISAEGFVQPIDPFWLSIVSVDKELLKDIKTVVEVS